MKRTNGHSQSKGIGMQPAPLLYSLMGDKVLNYVFWTVAFYYSSWILNLT